MGSERVTVVIPNWNGLAHLEECILALRAQTFQDFRTIVIDNASSDESVSWLHAHAPDVEVVVMPRNGGFGYAVNEGIRRAATRYVALLNNDTAVDPEWLGALVGALEERPEYSVAASCMVIYDQPDVVNAAGDVFDVLALAGRNRGFMKPASRYRSRTRVFGACAGAALYRRALFDDIGLFDEGFFLMSEDTEVSLRCLRAGHRCLYEPRALVRHKVSSSTRRHGMTEVLRLGARNQTRAVAMSFPALLLPLAGMLWPVRLARFSVARGTRIGLPSLRSIGLAARLRADFEGFRLGVDARSRHRVPDRVSALTCLRWLVVGVGPAS